MTLPLALATLLAWSALAAPAAHAQASCSSDGQAAPAALLERFINADCEACWQAADAPRPGRGTVALDWIVPGHQGEDAPLSAVASRDALLRLQALGRPAPEQATALRTPRSGARSRLRVAHGLAFNDYVAASIEQKPPRRGAQTAWLALVETIPAGSDGTLVERNLVRNLVVADWLPRTPQALRRLYESRSMALGANAQPDRLRVVGWVQDAQGRITSIAQSVCDPPR